jgi:CHRD domain
MKKLFAFCSVLMFAFFITAFTNESANHISKNTALKESAQSGGGYFYARLSGENVVPPVKTKASGSAIFKFNKDKTKVTYQVHLKDTHMVIMAHIHHAVKGKNGPIEVWLYKGKGMDVLNGLLSKGTITNKDVNLDSLYTWMEDGSAYVLIHTKKHPAGEIRGQIYYKSITNHKGMTNPNKMKSNGQGK